MSRYLLISSGEEVAADHPDRGVWQGATPGCGYWTDDWDKLKVGELNSIPMCPVCSSVGLQTEWSKMEAAIVHQEANGHMFWREFVMSMKEVCLNRESEWKEKYTEFLQAKGVH